MIGGIELIEDQATKRAWKPEQREGTLIFFEESPDFRPLPVPALSEGFKPQYRTVFTKLDRRCQKRKRITGILPCGMAPKIQKCVCFFKFVIQFYKSLRDIPGKAEKSIAICGIHSAVGTLLARTTDDPVTNLIIKPFCLLIEVVFYVAEFLQLIHDLKNLHTASNTKDAFQPNDSARPHAWDDFVAIATVAGSSFSERCPCRKFGPVPQDALALGELRPGQLDPTVFEQALHNMVPPDRDVFMEIVFVLRLDANS